jgi:hypothetical protein
LQHSEDAGKGPHRGALTRESHRTKSGSHTTQT